MSGNISTRDVLAKNILNKSGIPGMTYCINPYTGCSHGCIYCYATFMKDYSGHTEEWGEFVDAKINLPELLSKEVKKKKVGRVCIGTVADSYQPLEQEKKITRRAIEILTQNNFPFEILTKSSLLLRDIDLLKDNGRCSVEMSITTLDESIRKVFEPNADTVSNRLKAVKTLVSAGIPTTVFFGPVIPYFSDNRSALNEIFDTFESTGVKRVLVDKLNYFNKKLPLILSKIKNGYPPAITYYEIISKNLRAYELQLKQRILDIAKNKSISIEVLF